MTMGDEKCDVCGVNPPIGVASTIMPYSCAYCPECAKRFAQPMIVFECFWDDFGADFGKMREGLEQLETFQDGKYLTYKDWAERRRDALAT
jgi:hypothetical protein